MTTAHETDNQTSSYQTAQQDLRSSANYGLDPEALVVLTRAQVHATLALVEAVQDLVQALGVIHNRDLSDLS